MIHALLTGPAAVAAYPAHRSRSVLPQRRTIDRRLAAWICCWMLVGLGLRLAGARGGLWLDEAFSASFAHEAGTPARVFFAINHDNNHHLNTLWLLAMGWGAPPLAARALSIATGTLAIAVAGLFAGRRSLVAGVLAAACFALSPLIATYGMEARGYAPMLLAMLVALSLVDRWLADPRRTPPARLLGFVAAFGVLAHLTFVYALVAIGGWAAWELVLGTDRMDWRIAIRRWADLMVHALIAVVAMLALVWIAGRISPDGFHFGGYRPASLADFIEGTSGMVIFAYGDAWPSTERIFPLIAVLATLAALRWTPGLGRRRSGYAIAILGLPLAMLAARLGNASCPRYYLVSGAALLLLAAESLAALIAAGRRQRIAAIVLLTFAAVGAASIDAETVSNLRGDPGRAITALQARAPAGATVMLDQDREEPVLAANAASAGYPLAIVDACRDARFIFVDSEHPYFPADPVRCGHRYRPIATGLAHGLSGLHWRLYERQ